MAEIRPKLVRAFGDSTWGWSVEILGADLVVHNATATAFGGDKDPQDNGETASGFNTKNHPELIGCAIPMRVDSMKALSGSPIPHMPFGIFGDGRDNPHGAHVDISCAGKIVKNVPVVDLGPGKRTGHAIDLTVALARQFNPKASATNFSAKVDYVIRGAARFLA